MSLTAGSRAVRRPAATNAVTVETLTATGATTSGLLDSSAAYARKLSAVDRCIEIISDSMSKLPSFVFDRASKERPDHEILHLLNVRPNEAHPPSVRKKLLETSRLEGGNGYDWIIRDPRTYRPVELIPVPWFLVEPWRKTDGSVWYTITNPVTGEPMVLHGSDICHYKGPSRDGLRGISVLQRASEVVAEARAAQEYNLAFYESGGQPSGILRTESDLRGFVDDPQNPGSKMAKREVLRREWESIHAGPKNSHRTAILDFGLDYKPVASTNKDAQFLENKEMSIRDIARFFGVPLYKLQEGKQAYSSNEQNAIEYVVGTLHPIVTQYEEELTWKLLPDSDLRKGLEVRINMMAELRGDTGSRSAWYKIMREIGGFSANDIRGLEDLPNVPGGDEYQASLNFVPLRMWSDLSINRNGGNGNAGQA